MREALAFGGAIRGVPLICVWVFTCEGGAEGACWLETLCNKAPVGVLG